VKLRHFSARFVEYEVTDICELGFSGSAGLESTL
jgi:hypothetical protein